MIPLKRANKCHLKDICHEQCIFLSMLSPMGSKANVVSMVIVSDFCRVDSNFYRIYYLVQASGPKLRNRSSCMHAAQRRRGNCWLAGCCVGLNLSGGNKHECSERASG